MNIRTTLAGDLPALVRVLHKTGLFPAELLPDMIAEFLCAETSPDLWLTSTVNGEPVGFCYAAPEMLAAGTFNMLAIAVDPARQGRGVGSAIVEALESELVRRGARIVIVDTSATDAYAKARAFYRRQGYAQEATIRDYWAAGDAKVVFWKSLC